MVAAISQVITTLPPKIQARMQFNTGKVEVIQVIGASHRRIDGVIHFSGKTYGIEFKRGVLTKEDIHESLIERGYSIILRQRHQDSFAGIIFVAEKIPDYLQNESAMVKNWNNLANCGIATMPIDDLARSILTRALTEVAENKDVFTFADITDLLNQICALTTSSDGYSEWFTEDWKKLFFSKLCEKYLGR